MAREVIRKFLPARSLQQLLYALEAASATDADADAARAQSRAAYNDFFTLWKDAGPRHSYS